MAKITISGMEDKVNNIFGNQSTGTTGGTTKPATGGNTGGNTGGTGATGGTTGTTGGTAAGTTNGAYFGSGSSGNNSTKVSTTNIGEFLQALGLGNSSDINNSVNQFMDSEFGQNINNTINSGIDYVKQNVNKEAAETAINDLKNKYSEMLRQQHDYAANKLRKERDDALRENWVLQQQAEAALPEQLAAAGINGGASETTLANLIARYQGNRNDIRNGYMENLGDLAMKHSMQQAESERAYNEQWLDYLLSLAKMEDEYEKKKELAAMQQ